MMKKKQSGFTLIELAVVIAILAILAAVAIPRFANTTASAERSMINSMVGQLTSAHAMATAERAATPQGFNEFVGTGTGATCTATAGSTITTCTMDLANFGGGNCTVAATAVTCPNNSFQSYQGVTYNFNGGAVTVAATPVGTAPPL